MVVGVGTNGAVDRVDIGVGVYAVLIYISVCVVLFVILRMMMITLSWMVARVVLLVVVWLS